MVSSVGFESVRPRNYNNFEMMSSHPVPFSVPFALLCIKKGVLRAVCCVESRLT